MEMLKTQITLCNSTVVRNKACIGHIAAGSFFLHDESLHVKLYNIGRSNSYSFNLSSGINECFGYSTDVTLIDKVTIDYAVE